jgi:hypothetical protein
MSNIRHSFGRLSLALLVVVGALSWTTDATHAQASHATPRPGEPGIDCNPHGSPPREQAEEIRSGTLTLRPFRSIRFPRDPTWKEDPFRDVNWVFRYQSLRFILPLVRTWHSTGDTWYIRRAVFLVRDWIADNPRSAPASRVAWGDLQTAWRAMVLACIVQALPDATWARNALASHARLLATPSFYRWHGNHALGQDRALMIAGCTLRRPAWVRLATRRLTALVVDSVDDQGVTNEQAVFYQYYNYSGYRAAADRLRRCGYAVPPALRRIDRMPVFLAHATLPDGTYVMLGDTVRRSAASIAGTPAEFAATFGRRGPRPAAVFARYRAGFVFGRTGWGERRAFRDEAAYSLRFGPGQRSHGHAEHGSVTLYAYGKRLVDDSGTFTLNQDRWRWFALGRTAHNVVTVDGVAYKPSTTAPLTMTRSGAARDDLTVVDRGNAGVVHRRRVLFSRRLGYLVVEDRVSASTSRTFRQLWHLDAGTAPIVSARTVRTTRAAGNVRIIQLAVDAKQRIVEGRSAPVQGWISDNLSRRRPAPVVEAVARGRSVRYLTLVVPTRRPNDRVFVSNVRLTPGGWSFDIDVAGVREHIQATSWNSVISSIRER